MSYDLSAGVRLKAIDPAAGAMVGVVSVPLPEGSSANVGIQGAMSQALPVAWRTGADGAPAEVKQVLVMGIADAGLSEEVKLAAGSADGLVSVTPGGYTQAQLGDTCKNASSANAAWRGPTWQVKTLAEKKVGVCMNEINELVLNHDDREIGLRMGLRLDHKPGLRWWEFVTVEELWSGPVAKAIRAAGYLGVVEVNDDNICDPKRYNHGPFFHLHNWVYAEVYVVMFANGLVQVTARHVNNRFFDHGENLSGIVPMIGIRSDQAVAKSELLDGSKLDFKLGKSHLDVRRSSDLFGQEHPGKISSEFGLTVLQPYEGVEMLLGKGEPEELWNLHATDHKMWKGMARSFGFDLSLADKPIRTNRYLVPEGLAAQAGAIWADSVLPAHGNFDPVIQRLATHFKYDKVSHRFYQGSGLSDGEYGHVGFRLAYATGRADFYNAAVHNAYAMADLGVDHTDFTIRISGMKQDSIAMPLQRVNVMLTGYLETGDPYLLKVAQSVADAAYAMDRSNWPRRSFGRDAAYIRSLTRLYQVTGEAMYLRRAKDACIRAVAVQRPEGCFADQGGCYGAHGHLSQIIKPWMGCILTHAVCEFVDVAGPNQVLESAVKRYADWLLSVQTQDKDGKYWPYEIAWGENDEPPFYRYTPDAPRQKHPAGEMHLDYMARIMLFVSTRTDGDARYIKAWEAAYQRNFVVKNSNSSVYSGSRTIEDCMWHEAHLWNAKLVDGRLAFSADSRLIEQGREATIGLPNGDSIKVKMTSAGPVVASV